MVTGWGSPAAAARRMAETILASAGVPLIKRGGRVTLPQRLGGLITVLFALAVLAVGVFELAAPEAFDRIFQSLRPPPPFPP